MQNSNHPMTRLSLVAVACGAMWLGGCMIQDQSAPSLSGPSVVNTPGNSRPLVDFTIVPAVANVGQTLAFDASLTRDEGSPCGSLCTYAWDFGDFSTGSGVTTSHIYPLPGNYTVTLTVVDGQGGVNSRAQTVTVNGPAAPVAMLTVAPSSPAVGVSVTFNGSGSTVGAGATIVRYVWDFGDGSPALDTGSTPTTVVTYGSSGTFVVVLTVTDSLGRQASATATVTVVP
jgi:PKD repeat protein